MVERPVGSSGFGLVSSSMPGRCRSCGRTPKSRCELVQRAVHVGARVVRVVALPDRDRRAPEPVPADRPVPGVLQPLAELAVLDVAGHPGDLLVQLDHPVAELGHLDEPARHRLVDQRVPAAPAVRVGVRVGLLAHQAALLVELGGDAGVRVEDVLALEVGHDAGESRVLVDGEHGRDPGRVAGHRVGLAVGGCHVHDARAVLGRYVIGQDDPERVLGAELRERRSGRAAAARTLCLASSAPVSSPTIAAPSSSRS